ncbi:helix-turn-helix domain-containing protein [Pseudomonas aeruginosa]|uniref:helix-turn-helix domain-containing protein n=1 Tax=Pseudomonas aeruginosa TaxID=287 RepID=UPI000F84370A|nr:XRE family transcriptional regulator [Pseudomonas aeruginosa]RTR61067.1 helix-turn-helix domain-containing protein [Pseudomonas aeruginosa]
MQKSPKTSVPAIEQPTAGIDGFNVGSRLRAARQAKGLRIEEVAQRVGVSKSFISRFERDVVQASVATLLRVCDAIGIKPAQLFSPPTTAYVPAGEGTPISLGGEKMREYLIAGDGNEHMMSLYSVIEPGGGSGSEPYTLNADSDMVHVMSGQLEMRVGDDTYLLKAGDTLTFPPSIPHTWQNPSAKDTCTAIWVIVPPPS